MRGIQDIRNLSSLTLYYHLLSFLVCSHSGILWWTRVWKARNEKNPFEGIEIEFPHPPHSWDSRKYGAVQHRLTPSVPNKKNRPYAPHSWDWRKYGAVTPVQHQLNCSKLKNLKLSFVREDKGIIMLVLYGV